MATAPGPEVCSQRPGDGSWEWAGHVRPAHPPTVILTRLQCTGVSEVRLCEWRASQASQGAASSPAWDTSGRHSDHDTTAPGPCQAGVPWAAADACSGPGVCRGFWDPLCLLPVGGLARPLATGSGFPLPTTGEGQRTLQQSGPSPRPTPPSSTHDVATCPRVTSPHLSLGNLKWNQAVRIKLDHDTPDSTHASAHAGRATMRTEPG